MVWMNAFVVSALMGAAGVVAGCGPTTKPSGEVGGVNPMRLVREALASGASRIDVPKGTYEIDTEDESYFALRGVRNVVIDFHGARLNGVKRTRMFDLRGSTNVVLRNVTVDYVCLPFAQGVIERIDAEKNWDVRVLPGYPCPDDAMLARGVWPIQVYDARTRELKNPMRYPDARIVRTGSDTYRISGGRDVRGDVGDFCVWSVRDDGSLRDAVGLVDCANCRIEDVTVYSTPMGCGFNEDSCASNVYVRCRLVRCPSSDDCAARAVPRLRSGNHDAFNARRDYVGPTLDRCDFAYHCDDNVNISGFYAIVTQVAGDTVRVLPYAGRLCLAVGDDCQVLTYDGKVPPDVTVRAVSEDVPPTESERAQVARWKFQQNIGRSLRRAWRLTLDRPVDFPIGSCLISNRRQGNGFRIVNSRFGSTRARGLLIKASDGLIASNLIEKVTGSAIAVHPEFDWLEGGCSRNLIIRDNRLRGNGGGIYVGGTAGNGRRLGAEAHRGIVLENNLMEESK